MTKLAIFGDSYAAECDKSFYGAEYSWPYLIKNHYGVENFARPGSNLEFSIDRLIKNHEKFDRVVFLTTSHPRIFYPFKCVTKQDVFFKDYYFFTHSNEVEALMEVFKDDPHSHVKGGHKASYTHCDHRCKQKDVAALPCL